MSRVVDGRATPVAAFRKTSTYLDEERGEKTRSVEYCYSPMSNPRAPTSLHLVSHSLFNFVRPSMSYPSRSEIFKILPPLPQPVDNP